MIGLQSLCTSTGRFKKDRATLLLHTLSQAYLNKSFEITEFVGDGRALLIADCLGWKYTNFVHYRFNRELDWMFAVPKIEAFQLQKEPFCSCDNDALITKPLDARILGARVFVQSKDDVNFYQGRDMDDALKTCEAGKGIAYNMGVFGGKDLTAIHQYCDKAIDRAFKFLGQPINSITASMVVEQHCLGEFVREHNIRVEELIPMQWTDEDARRTGYAHFWGESKTDPDWAAKIETHLATNFPEAYNSFIEGWPKI